MKRLILAALVVAVIGVVAGSALAAGGASTIFNSTDANGPRTNQLSYGPAAYSFNSLGDQVKFAQGTARSLSSVAVTLSSWACQSGTWYDKNCVTAPGATFRQPITLNVYDPNVSLTTPIAKSTQTFDVPYRPSASTKGTGDDAGKWLTPAKECKNGLATDVNFNFSNQHLPDTVVYEIAIDTSNHGPSDSLNIAVTNAKPSVGTTDSPLWVDGQPNPNFDGGTTGYTPAVQFKASNTH
jgi:hypothetical protein